MRDPSRQSIRRHGCRVNPGSLTGGKSDQVFLDSLFLNRFSWLRYQNVRLEKLTLFRTGGGVFFSPRALSTRKPRPAGGSTSTQSEPDHPKQGNHCPGGISDQNMPLLNFSRRTFGYLNHENRLRNGEKTLKKQKRGTFCAFSI